MLDAHAVVPYHRPLPFVSSPSHPTPQLHPPTTIKQLPGFGLVSYCWVLSYTGWAAFVAIDPLCKPEDTAALLAAFERDVPGMKQYVAVSDRVCVKESVYVCVCGGGGACVGQRNRPIHLARRLIVTLT